MTAAVFALGVASCLATPGGKLSVGDPAPKFHVGKWYHGTPLKTLKRGHMYVVEFWATRGLEETHDKELDYIEPA